MPKKSRRKQIAESQRIALYKWEFLRRNVEYRKDYKEFLREFKPWLARHGYWFDETTEPWGAENLRFFATVIAPKARQLASAGRYVIFFHQVGTSTSRECTITSADGGLIADGLFEGRSRPGSRSVAVLLGRGRFSDEFAPKRTNSTISIGYQA